MAVQSNTELEEKPFRELGLHELFYETLSTRFDVSHYFQYAVLRSNCLITRELIEDSLRILINFQPFLRVKVVSQVDESKAPTRMNARSEFHERLYYAPCKVDFNDVLRIRTRVTDKDLHDIVKEEEEFLSREERYGDGPRWRLVVNVPSEEDIPKALESCKYEILFRFHHQFSDAVSGYDIVYRQFLPILNKILNQLPVDDVFLKPLELTPTYEEDVLGNSKSSDKHPAWYVKSGFSVLKAVTKLMKRGNHGRPAVYSEGAPFDNVTGVGIAKYSFRKELVDKILHERREKNVTVHSILLAGLSFGLVKLFEEKGIPLPKSINSGWPIDSRKKLKKYHSPQPLGMFIGTSGMTSMKVAKPFIMSKEVFWEKATKIGRQVEKNVGNQREKLTLDVMAYLTEHFQHKSSAEVLDATGMNQHFGLSNLGKCAPGKDMDSDLPKFVDAEEIYFGLLGSGFCEFLSTFFTTAVNHKGKLFFIMLYCKKWVKQDIPERFFSLTEEVLNEMCAAPETNKED